MSSRRRCCCWRWIFVLLLVGRASSVVCLCYPSVTSPKPTITTTTTTRASTHSRRPLPLRIDGIWYDVSDYAEQHKGGRWILNYAAGRDVTAMFYAIHLHGEVKARAVLDRLPKLKEEQLQQPPLDHGPHVLALDHKLERTLPPIRSPLRKDLQDMLRRRFPTIESTKATRAHWARTALFAVAALVCWVGWSPDRLSPPWSYHWHNGCWRHIPSTKPLMVP